MKKMEWQEYQMSTCFSPTSCNWWYTTSFYVANVSSSFAFVSNCIVTLVVWNHTYIKLIKCNYFAKNYYLFYTHLLWSTKYKYVCHTLKVVTFVCPKVLFGVWHGIYGFGNDVLEWWSHQKLLKIIKLPFLF